MEGALEAGVEEAGRGGGHACRAAGDASAPRASGVAAPQRARGRSLRACCTSGPRAALALWAAAGLSPSPLPSCVANGAVKGSRAGTSARSVPAQPGSLAHEERGRWAPQWAGAGRVTYFSEVPDVLCPEATHPPRGAASSSAVSPQLRVLGGSERKTATATATAKAAMDADTGAPCLAPGPRALCGRRQEFPPLRSCDSPKFHKTWI
uniref:uncharacterized protein LOC129495532 n=1 Tax=Nyctereutes procyonoides TaxID=34880 RepID=UPI0024446078|nr:uncharacterized protein LOC129495532 [Nyctereutes procyonoides]XP_055189231.1 uncharacterized protein LOC129514578 [Nyctereutes procyonoides]